MLHNYAFLEEPVRLIRATRLSARFHWPLEERTQARYDSAKENNYIEYIGKRAIGYELEQVAHEDDPLARHARPGQGRLAEGAASALEHGQD